MQALIVFPMFFCVMTAVIVFPFNDKFKFTSFSWNCREVAYNLFDIISSTEKIHNAAIDNDGNDDNDVNDNHGDNNDNDNHDDHDNIMMIMIIMIIL